MPIPLDFMPLATAPANRIAKAAMALRDTIALCCNNVGDLQKDLLRYLIQKETGKMFADADERTRQLAEQAKTQVMDLVNGDEVPLEPMV
jgi:hypothetical protein